MSETDIIALRHLVGVVYQQRGGFLSDRLRGNTKSRSEHLITGSELQGCCSPSAEEAEDSFLIFYRGEVISFREVGLSDAADDRRRSFQYEGSWEIKQQNL